MKGIESTFKTSIMYWFFKTASTENELEELASEQNNLIRGIFQTFSIGIVSSMITRSVKAAGFQEVPSSILATYTFSPLILSTAEALFSNETTQQSFQTIRKGIRTITSRVNLISSIALIILGQPSYGLFMIAAEQFSRR